MDTTVMVRLDRRKNKLAPLYEGPITVVRKTKAGSYVLKDEMNELLHSEYVPSELKIITLDESEVDDEVYEVERVIDHRVLEGGKKEYLVKWVGYDDSWNLWLAPDQFSSPVTINEYWQRVDEAKQTTDSPAGLKRKRGTGSKRKNDGNEKDVYERKTRRSRKSRKINHFQNSAVSSYTEIGRAHV